MTDVGDGALFADLLLSGWIGRLGDGEAAFLLLAVDHPDAGTVMPAVAAACGLNPAPDSVTEHVDPEVCRVEVGTDNWIRLIVGADYVTAPVGADGARMMRAQRRAVLAVGLAPMPPGLREVDYVERYAARACLGMVEAHPGLWREN